MEREYAALLGLDSAPPPVKTPEAPSAPRRARRADWIPLLAGLAPLLVIGLVYVLGELVGEGSSSGEGQLLALALVFLSSLLLAGATMPPGLIARASVSPASFARYRQPLALAGIGITVAITVFTLLNALAS